MTVGGNTFHARAPVTENARSPSEDQRMAGTTTSIGIGGRTRSLARMNLGHEPEVPPRNIQGQNKSLVQSFIGWMPCLMPTSRKTPGITFSVATIFLKDKSRYSLLHRFPDTKGKGKACHTPRDVGGVIISLSEAVSP